MMPMKMMRPSPEGVLPGIPPLGEGGEGRGWVDWRGWVGWRG